MADREEATSPCPPRDPRGGQPERASAHMSPISVAAPRPADLQVNQRIGKAVDRHLNNGRCWTSPKGEVQPVCVVLLNRSPGIPGDTGNSWDGTGLKYTHGKQQSNRPLRRSGEVHRTVFQCRVGQKKIATAVEQRAVLKVAIDKMLLI